MQKEKDSINSGRVWILKKERDEDFVIHLPKYSPGVQKLQLGDNLPVLLGLLVLNVLVQVHVRIGFVLSLSFRCYDDLDDYDDLHYLVHQFYMCRRDHSFKRLSAASP